MKPPCRIAPSKVPVSMKYWIMYSSRMSVVHFSVSSIMVCAFWEVAKTKKLDKLFRKPTSDARESSARFQKAQPQAMAESMVQAGWVHFLATDAHGSRSRRPLMKRAFQRVVELAGEPAAHAMCCHNPACVAAGETVSVVMPANTTRPARWFNRRQAA